MPCSFWTVDYYWQNRIRTFCFIMGSWHLFLNHVRCPQFTIGSAWIHLSFHNLRFKAICAADADIMTPSALADLITGDALTHAFCPKLTTCVQSQKPGIINERYWRHVDTAKNTAANWESITTLHFCWRMAITWWKAWWISIENRKLWWQDDKYRQSSVIRLQKDVLPSQLRPNTIFDRKLQHKNIR